MLESITKTYNFVSKNLLHFKFEQELLPSIKVVTMTVNIGGLVDEKLKDNSVEYINRP